MNDSLNIDSPIPVVDLDAENAVEIIGDACKNWGIFQVVNHNITKSLLDEIEDAVKVLFALPMEQKLKAERSQAGGLGYGVPVINTFFPNLPLIEGFTISGSPLEYASKLWPTNYKTFCDVVDKYQKEMKSLAMRIMWLMLGSLGITKNDVEWSVPKGVFEGGSSTLQLNGYPAFPSLDRTIGLAAHTDSCMLTILHQNTSGLEVHKEGFGWVAVPLLPGLLTVNVGDLFHIFCNGLSTSAIHRAIVNQTRYRVSMAYFFGPISSVKVSPLQKLIDNSHPQLYKPVTWSEYRDLRLQYPNNTLSKIRTSTTGNEYDDGNANLNSVQDE